MSRALFVELADANAFSAALDAVRSEGVEILDAFTPFPIEGLGLALGGRRDGRRVRACMLIGGLLAAAFAYGLEIYSAVYAYPFDVGGRPHNSWPTFMLFPFEFAILSAGVCGLIGLFWVTGLPRLHHPLFDIAEIDRVSNDRFVLALTPPDKKKRNRLDERLKKFGVLSVREVDL